jgi:putative transposase
VPYDRNKHHRFIRLKEHDYSSAGIYFITICTHQREQIFGAIVDGRMRLNEFGQIVANHWEWLTIQYPYVELDEWVVMPNHLHGILVVTDTPRRGDSRIAPTTHDATQPTSINDAIHTTIDTSKNDRIAVGNW